MNKRLITLTLALCALAIAPIARAGEEAEVTRAEFVAKAEPICKANVLANKRIFKGAKAEVKAGELKRASRHFFRAATAFAGTIRALDALPAPPADADRIDGWLDLLWEGQALIKRIGQALAAENKHRAESLSVDLNRNSTRANNTVLSFGFDYCRIEPSRFSG